jgi:hypothetical protein
LDGWDVFGNEAKGSIELVKELEAQ